jgi:dTDP-glucose pyrophosphorylase
MAGKGIRTQSMKEFKPFIEINNHEILFWFLFSIKGLIKKNDKLIFVTSKYFSKKFQVEKRITKILKELKIINKFYIIETTKEPAGQSISLKFAKNIIDQNKPLIVVNPDQYIDFDLPKKIINSYLPLYLQLGNKSGFVSMKSGQITKFVEKNNISNLACTGVYIVAKAKWLFSAIEEQIKNKDMLNEEYYLGPAFNYIIKKKLKVEPLSVRAKYDLGNPKDIKIFRKNNISRLL